MNQLAKDYDYVVVGLTLGSLVLAKRLLDRGHKFCILDSEQLSTKAVKFFPAVDKNLLTQLPLNSLPENPQELLDIFQQLGLTPPTMVPGPPLHFDKGQFKSFLGFGDIKIDAMDEYQFACGTETCIGEPEELWERYFPDLAEHIFVDQQLTDLEFANHKIAHLTTNGRSTIAAEHFVFFNHLPWLLDRLALIDTSFAPKLKKLAWYSTVTLAFFHPDKTTTFELNTPYLLMGGKEQPCLGQFSRIGERLVSRWQSYLSAELARDSEAVGILVKEMRKQVKRAFPELMAEGSGPILIHQQDRADLRQFSKKLSDFEGLSVISPCLSGHRGWLYEVVSSHRLPLAAANSNSQPALSL